MDSDTAVVSALQSIGKVIVASGATVAITFLCMSFAKLGLLSTVGPALAITVCIGDAGRVHATARHPGARGPSRLGQAAP